MHYPFVLDTPGDEAVNIVLIKCGGRKISELNKEQEVRPDIAEHVAAIDFPHSKVSVRSPTRTFFEKATLVHIKCERNAFRRLGIISQAAKGAFFN